MTSNLADGKRCGIRHERAKGMLAKQLMIHRLRLKAPFPDRLTSSHALD